MSRLTKKEILEITYVSVMSALQCVGMGSTVKMKVLPEFEAEVKEQFKFLREMSDKEMRKALNDWTK